jgi:para-aminobenzoate synthetase
VRTLLIDNYDSFTYNLFQLLAELDGAIPTVIENDDYERWAALREREFDNVVVSPGPGSPHRARDLGISARAILEWEVPLLGVCLGHQAICHLHGGTVARAPEPMHGRLSLIHHDGTELFEGLPSPFRAVRYHSLLAHRLPPVLDVTARTGDGLVMALRHRSRPMWGVQFHPESIATEHGRQLLANFRRLTGERRAIPRRPEPSRSDVSEAAPGRSVGGPPPYELHVRRLDGPADPDSILVRLFGASRHRFWLDSSLVVPGLSRFSFLGDADGPLGEVVSYDVQRREVTVRAGGRTSIQQVTLFDYLEDELRRRQVPGGDLPFDFNLGYVGYLGYELKRDCGAAAPHPSQVPDATLLFTDRAVAFDHEEGSVWLLALSTPTTRAAALEWLRRAADEVATARAATKPVLPVEEPPGALDLRRRHPDAAYRALIQQCQEEIAAGETYEVCLTNMLSLTAELDPLATYRTLRRLSPAPYAAFLEVPGLAVLSSSPERFLKVAGGTVESKPIKGTRPRGSTPNADAALARDLREAEKDRAENLMIVDLVRNDLGSVCRVGSVHVPEIFAVESYATVHQLVSTVRGTPAEGRGAVACVRAAFPGGSMTGAPKLRTMEIIDRLEGGSRGIYSGALGYFALGGAADLSIVIRTIVVDGERISMGVGGAIVALSDPEEEVAEMMLKGRALVRALAAHADVRVATTSGR